MHCLLAGAGVVLIPISFCTRRFEQDWARVISGVDEGIYGWVALNYLTSNLASTASQTQPGSLGELLLLCRKLLGNVNALAFHFAWKGRSQEAAGP